MFSQVILLYYNLCQRSVWQTPTTCLTSSLRGSCFQEKKGPKIGGETLLPRGEEQPKFLNSLK